MAARSRVQPTNRSSYLLGWLDQSIGILTVSTRFDGKLFSRCLVPLLEGEEEKRAIVSNRRKAKGRKVSRWVRSIDSTDFSSLQKQFEYRSHCSQDGTFFRAFLKVFPHSFAMLSILIFLFFFSPLERNESKRERERERGNYSSIS